MLKQNRILLTRCSLIYCAEDAIKRSMTSSSCRVCNCKTSEMRDLVVWSTVLLFESAIFIYKHNSKLQSVDNLDNSGI